jgi:DNA-binding transcriptional ArsR family regulator
VAEDDSRSVKRLTDPKALRALAHPLRLRLLSRLRTEGPLTATKAGEQLGESSASCSFHLRQLAKYGLAEEAGGGHGRERPWRATAMLTSVPEVADSPELAAAADLFRSFVLDRYMEAARHWLEAKADEPEEWQRAGQFKDVLLYVTADELQALNDQLRVLYDRYGERLTTPESRPAGSRLISFIQMGIPVIDRPVAR